MKALVTGATGFVGSHLVEALRARGADVTLLVRSPAKAGPLATLGVEIVAGGLEDGTALRQAAEGQDVIFHAAGVVAARSEAEFQRVNRDGTAAVVAAAAAGSVGRLVLVSSLAAAGPAERGHPLTGEEPPRPVTAYGRSKLAGEAVVREGRVPWTIVRPPMVYGPRDREVLKLFRLARIGIAPVFGGGEQELSAVHAADLGAALVAASTAPAERLYHVCHPETFTSGDFVKSVGATMGRRVRVIALPQLVGRALLGVTGTAARIAGQATILTADKANEFFQAAWTADPGPLTRDTGWRARYELASGLADTYRWYCAAGWL
ncbi:MAG TPA: NAD(P)-dependent oxidoreductase [Gemmatimonadales bacterium]|nr:NAD(P)-dependent oxidoreductase [Gemmatimonadales bacterium]